MRKNRRIIINGRTFYEKRSSSITAKSWYCKYKCYGQRDIRLSYDYPSYTKKQVWDDWYQWANQEESGIKNLKSIRGNGFYFTIGGILEYGGHTYFIYIKAGHNWIVEIE